MQYAIPQFTDVEDKLIGPLTLKQFLILLLTGGIILLFYSVLKISVFFFFFSFPFAVLGLALAFAKFNGRPMVGFIGAFINFLSKPHVRVFHRVEPIITIKKVAKQLEQPQLRTTIEAPESRLKKLAYLLDQKVHEEEELVGHAAHNT